MWSRLERAAGRSEKASRIAEMASLGLTGDPDPGTAVLASTC